MSEPAPDRAGEAPIRRGWMRAGQLLGLTFLIGPLADLAGSSAPPGQKAAIWAAVGVFVALYLVLLPPVRWIVCRGQSAIVGGLALFTLVAALPLVLGAPSSFVGLFVYVVAVAGVLLPARAAVAVTAVTAAAIAAGLALHGSDGSTVAAYGLTVLAVGAVMVALGSVVRANRALRAARLELAEAAVAEERLRIARDLHDLLGHTLSLIALKSELAAKLVDGDPGRARSELAEVQAVTREALAEVREAVQGYRRRTVDEALEGAREMLTAAGIDCRVESTTAGLPARVESVLAWAVREASTNVVRHSGARACAFTLRSEANAVSLQVDDDGGAAAVSSGGSGLAGLAERVRRLHGDLEAGARPEGGFRLRLTLPLEPA